MLEAILLFVFIAVCVLGGDALLQVMAALPLMGPPVAYYLQTIGPLQPGLVATLVHAGMVAQVLLLPLTVLLYLPAAVRAAWRAWQAMRTPQVPSGIGG